MRIFGLAVALGICGLIYYLVFPYLNIGNDFRSHTLSYLLIQNRCIERVRQLVEQYGGATLEVKKLSKIPKSLTELVSSVALITTTGTTSPDPLTNRITAECYTDNAMEFSKNAKGVEDNLGTYIKTLKKTGVTNIVIIEASSGWRIYYSKKTMTFPPGGGVPGE